MGNELNQGTWAENNYSAAPAGTENGWRQDTANGQGTVVQLKQKETEETRKFKENYGFFAPTAFLYAVFYAFCMYKNGSGVSFPFFVGGGLLFLCLSLSKLGLTLKEGSIFYMAAMILLGISTFCTDDVKMIVFNKLGIFLLMMSLLLKQFYDTSRWNFGKYMSGIFLMVLECMTDLGRPFSDGKLYRQTHPGRDNRKLWAAALGMVIAAPLLLVVLMLLSSADAVFRQMTDRILEGINIGNIMDVICRIAFIFFVSYILLSWLCRRTLKEEVKDRRTGEPIMAITVTGLLTLLYLLFSGIQIGGLFLGKLQLPAGYTYAMYAREGFFQLLAVGFINLVIVLVCIGFFRESRVLKAILTVMSFCTFVMIASSAMRMIIYIHYYYMTFLRLLVLWGLALLAFLFVGIVINIFKEDFPLFRYSVVVVTVLYLALSFARPDYIIARVNIAGISNEATDTDRKPFSDYAYLSWLSADAAPVLVPWMQEHGYRMEAYRENNSVIYADDNIDKYINRVNTDREESSGYKRNEAEGFGYYWMRDVEHKLRGLSVRTFNVSRYMALRELKTAASEDGRTSGVFSDALKNQIVAEIDGVPVSAFQVEVKRYFNSKIAADPLDDRAILDEIAREMFLLKSAKAAGITVSQEEIAEEIRREEEYVKSEVARGNQLMLQRQEEDEKFLTGLGMTKEEFNRVIYADMLLYNKTYIEYGKYYYANPSQGMTFEEYLKAEFDRAAVAVVLYGNSSAFG